ncbi:MAG: hypothetical protein HDQ89_10285 [Desulfovibrio sp.]|nr:hypothetical protein [Desulfovibrio sp.]
MHPCTIAEFTEEVMKQLKGFVRDGDTVEFEIMTYDSAGLFTLKELNEKGICVLSSTYERNNENFPKIKFAVVMK